MMSTDPTRVARFLIAVALLLPAPALAGERAGVVTTLRGSATVVRTVAPEPAALKFKDDVFVRDRITTGEQSFVRLLLGGKASVTAREHTVLTIIEVPGTATINLAAGRISVVVSREKMRPGDVVEITTPNAKAAIRGTIVIAEVSGPRSVITVLRGHVEVTRFDAVAGRSVGRPVAVGPRQSVTVSGAGFLPLPPPATISEDRAQALADDFTVLPKDPPAASMEAAIAASVAGAARDAAALLSPAATSTTSEGAALLDGAVSTLEDATAPVTSAVAPVVDGVTSVVGATTAPVVGTVAPAVNQVTAPVTPVINNATRPVTNVLDGLTKP
jgi:hypothetical protein